MVLPQHLTRAQTEEDKLAWYRRSSQGSPGERLNLRKITPSSGNRNLSSRSIAYTTYSLYGHQRGVRNCQEVILYSVGGHLQRRPKWKYDH